MYADFNQGFSIEMTKKQALSASHPGPCDDEVKALLQNAWIAKQLDLIGPSKIREELKEYGAWDEQELSDNEANRARIVWIAAGNIRDEIEDRD